MLRFRARERGGRERERIEDVRVGVRERESGFLANYKFINFLINVFTIIVN